MNKWPSWLTPNRITLFGFVMTIVYAHACYTRDPFWIITGFGLAELSDLFDGYVARKTGLITELGRRIDPIRDRLILLVFFYQLFLRDYLQNAPEIILVVTIIAAESGIWIMRALAERKTGLFVRTNGVGKTRQVCHIIAMSMIIVVLTLREPWKWGDGLILIGLIFMLFASFYALASYGQNAMELMRLDKTPKRA